MTQGLTFELQVIPFLQRIHCVAVRLLARNPLASALLSLKDRMQTPSTQVKTLVVFYSRTGTTRKVADALAQKLSADVLEVRTDRYPEGILGYLQAALDSTLGRTTPIRHRPVDLSKYKTVVIGTPIWNAAIAPPIRAFLKKHASKPRNWSFFLTHGGSGTQRAFQQMQELTGRPPTATLELRFREIQEGLERPMPTRKIQEFVRALRRQSPPSKAAA